MSSVVKLIKTKGDAIKCEAEMSEGFGHAGLIVLVENDKERAILGRTDPTFKTAKQAVDAMKETVETIRNGVPEPIVEEEPKVEPSIPLPPPIEKKPRKKRKSRKKKGAVDDRINSEGNDGSTEADGDRREGRGRSVQSGEARG